MERPAETQYPIHDLLRRRWSPRAFSERMVEVDKLHSILEAARWAPSCFNEQPWYFLIATKEGPEEFERLLSCLVEGNVAWAKNAPVLMLSVAKLSFSRNDKPNKQSQHDLGLAVENLVIQAQELGLVTHQMGGFHADKARQLFGIPEGFEPIAAIALGYPGDLNTLSPELRERELAPRIRKPLERFVFSGHWGQASSLVQKQIAERK